MPDSSHRYREDLRSLETRVVGGLDLALFQLTRAQEATNYQDVELAQIVVGDDTRLDRLYKEVQRDALELLSRPAPGADEVRNIAALLHIVRCVERMGDQCVNIATLVPLSGHESPKDKPILDAVQKMSLLVRSQLIQTRDALRLRDLKTAESLAAQDTEVNRLNRVIFQRAVEIGDDFDVREWAMFMILVARCVERIGDNTVDIGEQVSFIITGVFRDLDGTDFIVPS